MPAEQTWPAAQASPQAPQLAGSTLVVTQLSPHWVVPPVHSSWHSPAVQVCPAAQASPQSPQFLASVVVSTQRVPHSFVPPEQCRPQAPCEQT
jgi:hypothetical protein